MKARHPQGLADEGAEGSSCRRDRGQAGSGRVRRIHRKPIGSYTYWKRRDHHFDLCDVAVYFLEVEQQLADCREKGQRRRAWLLVDDAIELVAEPGLVTSMQELPNVLARKRKGRRRAELHSAIVNG